VIQFKLREIVLIFVMLVLVTSAVFGLGIFLGHEFQQVGDKVVKQIDLEIEKETEPQPPQAALEEKTPEPILKPLRGFTIQVALLEDEEAAKAEKDRIEALGFPSVFIRQAELDERKWYFIDMGYFKEKSAAQEFAARLLGKGMVTSYLIRRTGLDPSAGNRE